MTVYAWMSATACRAHRISATERCEQCRHSHWSPQHTAVLLCTLPSMQGVTDRAARCNAWTPEPAHA